MAATGLVLYGFVVAHMLGNLQVYLGPGGDQRLRRVPAALPARPGHLDRPRHPAAGGGAPRLGRRLADARELVRAAARLPRVAGARVHATPRARWSGAGRCCSPSSSTTSRTSPLGNAHPDFVRGDVFRNVVVGFQNPFASAFYILAMLALGLHMYHGFWSMLQTLGLSHPRWNRVRRGPVAAARGRRRRRQHLDPARRAGGPQSTSRAVTMELKANVPVRSDRREVVEAPLRHEAGEPGQQAQVQGDRGRQRARRRGRRRLARRARLQRRLSSATRTARAGRTRSRPRAASTPPRTTRTTATPCSGCSTTRSRAATSARARRTSTAWPSCRSRSSTSAWPRACRSRASTAARSPTAPSAAPSSRAPSTRAARPASSCCSAPTRR